MRYARQISSGGVLFRPLDGGWEVALIKVKDGRTYALPKGLVEEGEDPEVTAVREVREETGMEGRVVAPLGYTKYYYFSRKEDTRYFKLVHFYLLRYLGGSEEDHDWEVQGVEWVPAEEAPKLLSYKGEREIMERALEELRRLGGSRRGSGSGDLEGGAAGGPGKGGREG